MAVSALLCLAWPVWAAQERPARQDLTALALEELLDINLHSAMKVSRPLLTTPSAVYVLNADAIRRSGARSVPELLRLIPGVEVTRFGTGKWGIGIRGFNGGVFTNRLLILLDGRSVFSPAKIGMFWDSLDIFVPDIERIVVVRGPGAALWGSNAFNGVINIVTRSAKANEKGFGYAGGGLGEQAFAGLSYSHLLKSNWRSRVHAKAFLHDASEASSGQSNGDAWRGFAAGWRVDGAIDDTNQLNLQLDAHRGLAGETILLPRVQPPVGGELVRGEVVYSGASMQGRWERRWNWDHQSRLSVFLDHVERRDLLFDLRTNTLELDWQSDISRGPGRRYSAGLSYRMTWDRLPDQYLRFTPAERAYALVSVFGQLEQVLVPGALEMILGAKLERNEFSGSEFQPNVRLLWTAHPEWVLWAALSRAQRSPSRTEHDVRIDYDLVALPDDRWLQLQIRGDSAFRSERLSAVDMGFRYRPRHDLHVDVALFRNDYRGLRTLEPGEMEAAEQSPPDAYLPLYARNGANAVSWGGEVLLQLMPRSNWQLEMSYSHVRIRVDPRNSLDSQARNAETESPKNRVVLRSAWDLSRQDEINSVLRYVGAVERHRIDAYLELDVNWVRRLNRNLEVTLGGRNLLHATHEEFVDPVVGTPRTQVRREAYLQMAWRF